MRHFTRYFLIGLLVSGMAIDSVSARRLFRRSHCWCACRVVCVPVCPSSPKCLAFPACSVPNAVDLGGYLGGYQSPWAFDAPLVTTDSFAESHLLDSSCQGCPTESSPQAATGIITEVLPEIFTEALFVPSPVPSPMPVETYSPAPEIIHETIEEFLPAETTESYIEAPSETPTYVAPQSYPSEITPDPLDIPEVNKPRDQEPIKIEPKQIEPAKPLPPAVPTPAEPSPPTPVEPPSAGTAGDRYSNSNNSEELFGPPAAAEGSSTRDAIFPPATDSENDSKNDSIFTKPTSPEQQPEPQPQPEQDMEDIFGAPLPEKPGRYTAIEEAEVAEENEEETLEPPQDAVPPTPAEPETETDKNYDPFAEAPAVRDKHDLALTQAGGLQSETLRTWSDNTATFECRARLVRVTPRNIVLRQSTGTQRVVPLSRLADADLRFVHQQITALRVVRARNVAAEKLLATAWEK